MNKLKTIDDVKKLHSSRWSFESEGICVVKDKKLFHYYAYNGKLWEYTGMTSEKSEFFINKKEKK